MYSAGGWAISSVFNQHYFAVISGSCGGFSGTLAQGLLSILALPYGLAVRMRNALYDHRILPSYHVGVPTICVGNISCGGTGKTPTVIAIVRMLLGQGHQPAILSRGYKGTAEMPADEVLLYKRMLPDVPVVVGADRVDCARRALREYGPDVLVMDDGFGHRRLRRDLDIVLLAEPTEKVRLLPRGLYREPASSLARADIVISTFGKAEQNPLWAWHKPKKLLTSRGSTELSELQGRKVLAFCGIGNPGSFEQAVRQAGAEPAVTKFYADHHRYSQADFDDLAELGRRENCHLAVTTVKDWVRIEHEKLTWPGGNDCQLSALEIEMSFSEQAEKVLNRKLADLLGK